MSFVETEEVLIVRTLAALEAIEYRPEIFKL
jgi:hypothetical protein